MKTLPRAAAWNPHNFPEFLRVLTNPISITYSISELILSRFAAHYKGCSK